jgi:carbon monoxide dehydrogenase subunit G
MKLTNEVIVPAPLERTWSLLLDVPRVVSALPGATVESDGAEGVYRGALKVRLGPVAMEYEGTARLQDVDEDEHVASFRVEGRERRGHGGAAATITNRLVPAEGGTRLVVETDLSVTGRAAQFGRGLMEDVAGHLLEQFARGLEAAVVGGEEEVAPAGPAAAELDLGAAAWQPLLRRYGPFVAVGVSGFILGLALRRR